MSQKTITVIGATGQQGASVISWVLSDPNLAEKFRIRGVTRNPSTAKLPTAVEAVQADLDDVESLKRAFAKSDVVFGMTDYWAVMDREREITQGKNIADAAKDARVSHLVWSSSTNVTTITEGRITDCAYFDSKAIVAEYLEQIKGNMTVTYVVPGVFMQNFSRQVVKASDGSLTWPMPWEEHKTMVPYLDARDSGAYVSGVLAQSPQKTNGSRFLGVSEWLTPAQILERFNLLTGLKVKFVQVSAEEYLHLSPREVGRVLTANMVWMRDYGFFGVGFEKRQAESDWVIRDQKLRTWAEYVESQDPWVF